MRVVWLCHFANNEINNLFGTNVNGFAPWITELIKLFNNNNNVELFIVAPNVYTNLNINFSIGNIRYHFYKFSPHWVNYKHYERYRIGYILGFKESKINALKIIEDINPDIVHLFGAENPYYSSVILRLYTKYKCLTTIQGFARNSKERGLVYNYFRTKRIRIEHEIIQKSKYVGLIINEEAEVIKAINPNAFICWHKLPINIPQIENYNVTEKIYDIAYYARVCSDKGIEDLIAAVQIIQRDHPNLKLVVIGGGSENYINLLKQTIKKLKLVNNISFVGHQDQLKAYALLSKARIYVIPTHHDIIPGTLIESMFLKIPSIAYDVGGIASLNREYKCVLLVEKGNIKQLAESMLQLMSNIELAKDLSANALEHVTKYYQNTSICSEIENIYKHIVNEE